MVHLLVKSTTDADIAIMINDQAAQNWYIQRGIWCAHTGATRLAP